jgi:hypothetical protein
MSVIKFELKTEHIKLVRQLNIIKVLEKPAIDGDRLFGDEDIYPDIDLILNGKTKDVEADTGLDNEYSLYTDVEKADMNILISELKDALDIILFTGSFEPGIYIRRSYERNWIRQK